MKHCLFLKKTGIKLRLCIIVSAVIFACSDKGDDPPQRPERSGVTAAVVPGVNSDFTAMYRVEEIVGPTPADVVELYEGSDWEWDSDQCRVNLYIDHDYPLYLNLVGSADGNYCAVSTVIRNAGDVVAANEITSLAVSQILECGLSHDIVTSTLKEQFSIETDPFTACLAADRDSGLTLAMQSLESNFTAETLDEAVLIIHTLDREDIDIDTSYGFPSAIPALICDVSYGYIPLDIAFTNLSVGKINSYTWDFDDGLTSDDKDTAHRFEDYGSYNVSLTVATGDGTLAFKETSVYAFTTAIPPPSVTLTTSADNGEVPLTVSFEAQADGAVFDYIWDFGDSASLTGIDPDHTFSSAGRHTVAVRVMGAGGVGIARKVIHAGKFTAAIATAATDFSAGAHTIVDVDSLEVWKNILPTTSDITMVAHGSHFYRIERYLHDSVAKFSINDPESAIWQYSALEATVDGASSNPYDLVFVSDQKAYLIRYGSARAWIVNPSATDETSFKTGELDLSVYGDQDGIPEMAQGVLVDGRLYIVMQRMDRTHSSGIWQPNRAYVAVFDTDSDTEIDTGYGTVNDVTGETLKGIPLEIENPISMQFLPENHTIYVQGVGTYPMTGYSGKDTGGIEAVEPESYTTLLVLDDGERANDEDELPWGNISGMVMVSPQKGYFVGYVGWNDNSLYAFRLNDAGRADTGSITALDYLSGKNITVMEAGVSLDNKGRLWVCNRTDNGIVLIDPETDAEIGFVETGLPPLKTVFCFQ